MNRHNQKEPHSIGSITIGIVFCVWFFGSMAAAFLAKKAGQPGWAAFCLGQVFFVIGIMVVKKEIKEGLRQPVFFVFPVVGFFMALCGFLWQTGTDEVKYGVLNSVPLLILGLFLFVGILVVVTVLRNMYRNQRCTIAVLGKCVEVKCTYSSSGSSGAMFYCPVYEYAYNGRFYTGCEEVYVAEDCVAEGEYREIFINPEQPEQIFERGRGESANIILLCLGLFFIAVSAITLSYCYHANF